MIKELKSAMTASISEVLETMFYMPLEFEDYTVQERKALLEAPDLRLCKLTFTGKISGYFLMAIRDSLLVTMARDFMGEDKENITRQHTDGIIKEALNMVAGHMFSNMDKTNEYNLGIPELMEDKSVQAMFSECPSDYLVVAESIEGVVACRVCLE